MKTINKHLKKAFMWYKVKELDNKGFNKSQISRELELDRSTVRKYLSKDEQEFHCWIETGRHLPKKLQMYYEYVKDLLESYPFLSAAQVEDRLKERYTDLPEVHSKTVYNFVNSIRKRHQIHKGKEKKYRAYEKLPELDYGQQAQVDFGEYYMQTSGAGRKKVYFFVMVLSRSRQKYIYFQDQPFTSRTTVHAHELALKYFNGQPRKILYDQDRVLIVSENLGDILLTQEFRSYCSQMDFEAIFCRKSDPESKGKVENVVGYVKKSFLSGRIYKGADELNASALGWLSRTGNGKEHSGIKKIPHQEWLIEREHLLPLPVQLVLSASNEYKPYMVRKDNTISYKSNFYTLPLSTYQGADTQVLLHEKEDYILLFDKNMYLLTTHKLCLGRGVTIRNTDHTRDKSQSIAVLKIEVAAVMQNTTKATLFMELIEKDKSRYLRDNLLVLKKGLADLEPEFIAKAIDFCLEHSIYNAKYLTEAGIHYQKQQMQDKKVVLPWMDTNSTKLDTISLYDPKVSKISTYEKVM
ncbi:MAG: IS21 family transposase [Spirochaetae bacterium HGW-Spirochaetae-5]|jgi:transposase|nr:MAG: IS21 family transposase [Spirochaetae bacterium HGW-Spirochaetae-5]